MEQHSADATTAPTNQPVAERKPNDFQLVIATVTAAHSNLVASCNQMKRLTPLAVSMTQFKEMEKMQQQLMSIGASLSQLRIT